MAPAPQEAPAGFALAIPADMAVEEQQGDSPRTVALQQGHFKAELCDAIAISHTANAAELMAKWNYKDDQALAELVETVIPGRYWKVSHQFQGPPAWRREGHPPQPFLFYAPQKQGWVVSWDVKDPNDSNMLAWAPKPHDSADWPGRRSRTTLPIGPRSLFFVYATIERYHSKSVLGKKLCFRLNNC